MIVRNRVRFAIVWLVFSCASATAGFAADDPARERYLLHCSGCHRLDGVGVPGTTPSLHGLGALLEHAGGRAYLGSVPGVAQAPLGDAELARLLNWVIETFSGAPPEPPYTADEMTRLRVAPLRDPAAARAALRPPPEAGRP